MKSLKLIKNITLFSCIFSVGSNRVIIDSNCCILPFVGSPGCYHYLINSNNCGKHSVSSSGKKEFLSNILSYSCAKCILSSCIEFEKSFEFVDINV
jgi:hypothetical protein